MAGINFFDFQQRMVRQPERAAPAASPLPKAAGAATDALTVSQLTTHIERAIKAGLPAQVLVRGEVSNYKHHGSSGHSYFTLKDATACIDCVMFRSDAAKVKFAPADGMELLVSGRVAVYPQRGRYQLYVTRLDPLGQGALELAFQQLKAKLEAEGLFAPERKKPIPPYPMRIALVTSRATAALQDMLKVLRRFAWVRLALYHVPVQGDGSAEQIAAAINHLSRCPSQLPGGGSGFDLILLARGGGSLEDLWEFNEEIVARAIVASQIPVITGIGHEVDVSIADLVADYHAHTPTEAAQVAIAQWRTAGEALEATDARLRRAVCQIVQDRRQQLLSIERHDLFRRPLDRINLLRQLMDDRERAMLLGLAQRFRGLQRRLQDCGVRLERHHPAAVLMRLRERLNDRQRRLTAGIWDRFRGTHQRLTRLAMRLGERHPRHAMRLHQQRLDALATRLDRAMRAEHHRRLSALEAMGRHLLAIGPEQVLRRGYSITMLKKQGTVVRSVQQIKGGERLVTRFADGQVESVADDPNQLPLFE